MSLVSCNECDGKVSESAVRCPHCGAEFAENTYVYKPPARAEKLSDFVFKVIAFGGTAAFIYLAMNNALPNFYIYQASEPTLIRVVIAAVGGYLLMLIPALTVHLIVRRM